MVRNSFLTWYKTTQGKSFYTQIFVSRLSVINRSKNQETVLKSFRNEANDYLKGC